MINEISTYFNFTRPIKQQAKKSQKEINAACNKAIERKRAMKEAELKKAASLDPDKAVIDAGIAEIINESEISFDKKLELLDTAKETFPWIKYSIYYMTNPDALLLMDATENEKQLCNAIGEEFHFGKIFPESDSVNLNLYDINSCQLSGKPRFILSRETLSYRNSPDIQEKIAKKMALINSTIEDCKVDENNIVKAIEEADKDIVTPIFHTEENPSPIIFHTQEELEAQRMSNLQTTYSNPNNISDIEYNYIESCLGSILENIPHYYIYDPMNINRIILKYKLNINDFEKGIIIDSGKILGGTEYVTPVLSAQGNGSICFVPLTETNLINKIILNPMYILSIEESAHCDSLTPFKDPSGMTMDSIYKYIDFNNTEILSTFSEEDKQLLGYKLIHIFILFTSITDQEMIRVRFNKLHNVDDFELVSDDKVINVLHEYDALKSFVCNGNIFNVSGNKVTWRFENNFITEVFDPKNPYEIHVEKP